MSKNIGENKSKNLMLKIVRIFLIMLNNLLQKHLKLRQKKVIQKTAETTGDLIGNKIAKRITKISKSSPQKIQKQINMIKKYLKKDIYLQMEDRK